MMSIVLALVLLAVLLVVCGPHAYRKLVKKCRCGRPEPPHFQAPVGGGVQESIWASLPGPPLSRRWEQREKQEYGER